MLVGASVALNAIVEIAYTFLDMLTTNAFGRVLVAAVTSVAAVVVADMTDHTAGVVVAV